MKKFFSLAMCVISCAAVLVSCGKKAGDGAASSNGGAKFLECRLPNSTIVFECDNCDPSGTFMEKFENMQTQKNEAAFDMINETCSEFFGQEFIDGLKSFAEKNMNKKVYATKFTLNADGSAVTIDMFDDDTPQRFLDSVKLLGYLRFAKSVESDFNELVALFAKSPAFEASDYAVNGYAGKKVRLLIPEEENDDNIVLPEIALVCGNGGCEVLFGNTAVVEDAVNGKLAAPYSEKIANALSYTGTDGVSKGQFAIVPLQFWIDAILENMGENEYAPLIKDFCSLTASFTLKKDSEDIKLAARFGKPESALNVQALAEGGLGFLKMMIIGAIEDKPLPLLQTLKVTAEDVSTVLSFTLVEQDIVTFTKLIEESAAAAELDDDGDWSDEDDDEWSDEDEAELEDDAA